MLSPRRGSGLDNSLRPDASHRDRTIQFLSTLLPEMRHIVFQVYACREDDCYRNYDNCGTTGYADA